MEDNPLFEVLKVVLIVLLIYLGFKILLRWLAPVILKYFLKKIGKKFGQSFGNFNAGRPSRSEGEVTIEKKPKSTRKSDKEVGEYIDYEEID